MMQWMSFTLSVLDSCSEMTNKAALTHICIMIIWVCATVTPPSPLSCPVAAGPHSHGTLIALFVKGIV